MFFNHWYQFLEIDRLWKDTQYAGLDGRKDDIDRRVASHKHCDQIRPCPANTSEQIDAVHARHLIVKNRQPILAAINKSQGSAAILGRVGLITQCRKQFRHQFTRVGFIIDD